MGSKGIMSAKDRIEALGIPLSLWICILLVLLVLAVFNLLCFKSCNVGKRDIKQENFLELGQIS